MSRGAAHIQDSEKTRNEHQNVLIHHLVSSYRTDTSVSHTTKTVMFFGVFNVEVPLGVYVQPQHGLCPVILLCFLCSHAREYLFPRTYTCSFNVMT
jgi:hypothetical protein